MFPCSHDPALQAPQVQKAGKWRGFVETAFTTETLLKPATCIHEDLEQQISCRSAEQQCMKGHLEAKCCHNSPMLPLRSSPICSRTCTKSHARTPLHRFHAYDASEQSNGKGHLTPSGHPVFSIPAAKTSEASLRPAIILNSGSRKEKTLFKKGSHSSCSCRTSPCNGMRRQMICPVKRLPPACGTS